jgi:uncharacterized protein
MNEHPNAMLMQRAYDAFDAHDLAALGELIAEDASWHQPGHNAISGDYVGRDAILDYFGKLMALSFGTFKAEVVDIVADDDRVIAVQRSTAHRDGQAIDTRDVLVTEVVDGKLFDTQVYESDPDLEDDFWRADIRV